MRFLIEYKNFKDKETKNLSLGLVETFLNEHLIAKSHGKTFECMLVRFISHPPRSKKFKCKALYDTIAEVEIAEEFQNCSQVNVEDFKKGLSGIAKAIQKVWNIEKKEEIDYEGDLLITEFQQALQYAPSNMEDLLAYKKREEHIKFGNRIKRTDNLLRNDAADVRPLTKKIVGIRISDMIHEHTLHPFSYIYSELFSNLLRKSEVKLPGYDEIGVNIGETMEHAKQEISVEPWYKYTYAFLDIDKYLSSNEDEKSRLVFESVCSGLRLITTFDHLEKDKIESVIDFIKTNGTGIELTYHSKQTKNYLAEIVYTVPKNHLTKAEYKLKVTDLVSGKTGIAHINFIDTYWAPYSFGEIRITKSQINIKGRKSYRAEISRKADRLPDEYLFNLQDILN